MPAREHVQSRELTHVEEEKQILAKEMIDQNNKVVDLRKQVAELQQKIDSHICAVLVPENPHNLIEQLIKTLIEM